MKFFLVGITEFIYQSDNQKIITNSRIECEYIRTDYIFSIKDYHLTEQEKEELDIPKDEYAPATLATLTAEGMQWLRDVFGDYQSFFNQRTQLFEETDTILLLDSPEELIAKM